MARLAARSCERQAPRGSPAAAKGGSSAAAFHLMDHGIDLRAAGCGCSGRAGGMKAVAPAAQRPVPQGGPSGAPPVPLFPAPPGCIPPPHHVSVLHLVEGGCLIGVKPRRLAAHQGSPFTGSLTADDLILIWSGRPSAMAGWLAGAAGRRWRQLSRQPDAGARGVVRPAGAAEHAQGSWGAASAGLQCSSGDLQVCAKVDFGCRSAAAAVAFGGSAEPACAQFAGTGVLLRSALIQMAARSRVGAATSGLPLASRLAAPALPGMTAAASPHSS